MIAYHGGNKPSSKEEGMAQMQKWQEWIESLGDKIINPGTPLPNSKIVTASYIEDEISPDRMMGYAIVKATNMDEATKIAQTDPFLENEGTIRVFQMMELT